MCQIILALEEAVSRCHQRCIPTVETQGQMLASHGWNMCGRGLEPPQRLLPESKQNQTGINKDTGLPRNGGSGVPGLTHICFAWCASCGHGNLLLGPALPVLPCSAVRCPPVFLYRSEKASFVCKLSRTEHSVHHVLQNRFVCKWCWPLPWYGLLEKNALRRHTPPRRQHCDFCNLHVVFLT